MYISNTTSSKKLLVEENILMKYNEEEPEDLESNPSLTGPNELNEEDLGLGRRYSECNY